MLNNELMIFFLIMILIGLSFYDLKYSIIFCIILYLVYLYFNKLTYESNFDEYKEYDDELNSILRNIEIYRNYDNQNYKLGLKYYNNVLKNIKLLSNIDDKFYFESILEKTKIFLEKTIEKFNSILFSIEDIDKSEKLNNLIIDLHNKFNKIIDDVIFIYNNRLKIDSYCDSGMFCNDDLILNKYLRDKKIYNKKPKVYHNMFDKGKYIGLDKSNEIDYHSSKAFNKSSGSTVMNKYLTDMIPITGFTNLDDIYTKDMYTKDSDNYNSNWSLIFDDRDNNKQESKTYVSKINTLMKQMDNPSSNSDVIETKIDQLRNEYLGSIR